MCKKKKKQISKFLCKNIEFQEMILSQKNCWTHSFLCSLKTDWVPDILQTSQCAVLIKWPTLMRFLILFHFPLVSFMEFSCLPCFPRNLLCITPKFNFNNTIFHRESSHLLRFYYMLLFNVYIRICHVAHLIVVTDSHVFILSVRPTCREETWHPFARACMVNRKICIFEI